MRDSSPPLAGRRSTAPASELDTTFNLEAYIGGIAARLAGADIENPRADAIRLVKAVLADINWQAPAQDAFDRIELAVRQREAHRSIARIVGRKQFRGITVRLADDVFEPCAASEILIDHAVRLWQHRRPGPRILDIGCGSGNLLLAALHELPHASGAGIDIAPAAVALARENARELRLQDRASFHAGNLADACSGTFDLVLCTLPFIPTRILPTLAREVLLHDPPLALDGGPDGYRCYRKLAKQFRCITRPRSVGLFQLSREFIAGAERIFARAGYRHIRRIKDPYGFPAGLLITVTAG